MTRLPSIAAPDEHGAPSIDLLQDLTMRRYSSTHQSHRACTSVEFRNTCMQCDVSTFPNDAQTQCNKPCPPTTPPGFHPRDHPRRTPRHTCHEFRIAARQAMGCRGPRAGIPWHLRLIGGGPWFLSREQRQNRNFRATRCSIGLEKGKIDGRTGTNSPRPVLVT